MLDELEAERAPTAESMTTARYAQRWTELRDLRFRREYHDLLFVLTKVCTGTGRMRQAGLYNKAKTGHQGSDYPLRGRSLCGAAGRSGRGRYSVISAGGKSRTSFCAPSHCLWPLGADAQRRRGALGFSCGGWSRPFDHGLLTGDHLRSKAPARLSPPPACTPCG